MLEELRDSNRPVELRGLMIGEAGRLARCEPKLPIAFGFNWRRVLFQGEVERTKDGLVLRLSADVAVVPFSAEDVTRPAQLLSLLRPGGCGMRDSLMPSPNNRRVLPRELKLPRDASLTAQTLVTQIATALLNSAPYLDLMVEFGLVAQQGD
jgi:hypothetical protein